MGTGNAYRLIIRVGKWSAELEAGALQGVEGA
jgi:hypothetical protein